MSALFNFQSLLIVVMLVICTCSYVRAYRPSWLDSYKEGFMGVFRRCAVIGDRLSPYVAIGCVLLAASTLFLR